MKGRHHLRRRQERRLRDINDPRRLGIIIHPFQEKKLALIRVIVDLRRKGETPSSCRNPARRGFGVPIDPQCGCFGTGGHTRKWLAQVGLRGIPGTRWLTRLGCRAKHANWVEDRPRRFPKRVRNVG